MFNLNDKTTLYYFWIIRKGRSFQQIATLNLSYISDKGTFPYPTIPEISSYYSPGVNNLLSSCNLHKSPGPDNLHLKQGGRLYQCWHTFFSSPWEIIVFQLYGNKLTLHLYTKRVTDQTPRVITLSLWPHSFAKLWNISLWAKLWNTYN